LRATHANIDGTKRIRLRHKQTVSPESSEREVRHHLREFDAAERVPVAIEDTNPILGGTPEISVFIEPETIRNAWRNLDEDVTAGKAVVGRHIENT